MTVAGTEAVEPTSETLPAWFVDAYQRMWEIRLFEEAMHKLFLRGEIHGTTHLSSGQEANPVGISRALRDGDLVAGTYRGHGHALSVGTEPGALAAEMLGRSTGVCGGRGGSMNVIDLEHGLLGCFGIVGASAAAAVGAGLALKGKGKGGVAVAFFGDGANNIGYLHESLNFAKVHRLPVVFVCENNLYGEFTPWQNVTAGGDLSARAASYGLPAAKVDGNDLLAVFEAAEVAVARARDEHEPSYLECLTYRHYGHSKSDPGAYRTKEELAAWKERDPLTIARGRLAAAATPETELDALEAAADEKIEAAIAFALDSPYPDPADDAATEYRA